MNINEHTQTHRNLIRVDGKNFRVGAEPNNQGWFPMKVLISGIIVFTRYLQSDPLFFEICFLKICYMKK